MLTKIMQSLELLKFWTLQIFINDLVAEGLLNHMKGEIPAHVLTVFNWLKAAFINYTEDVKDVEDVDRRQEESAPEEFCALKLDYVIHTTFEKFRRLVYSKNWDMISTMFEVEQTETSNTCITRETTC